MNRSAEQQLLSTKSGPSLTSEGTEKEGVVKKHVDDQLALVPDLG